MEATYSTMRSSMLSLNLSRTFDVSRVLEVGDPQSQAVVALIEVNAIYVTNIQTLLSNMFTLLDNDGKGTFRSSILSKEQVVDLFNAFPAIYSSHSDLHDKLDLEIRSSKRIGKVLYGFLCQMDLMTFYENYFEKILNIETICNIVEARRNDKLKDLNVLAMSPIRIFGQLRRQTYDIYNNTRYDHQDRVDVYGAISMLNYFSEYLGKHRRHFRAEDLLDIKNSLEKIRLPFFSTTLVSCNLIMIIKTNFHSKEKAIKIPYYLILYDQNVVGLPKNLKLNELSMEVAFCYSLKELSLDQQEVSDQIFRFEDDYSSMRDSILYPCDSGEIEDRYQAAYVSNVNDSDIKRYGDIVNDYSILLNVVKDMKTLKFHYKEIDLSALRESLVLLKATIKEREKQFGSIITLRNKFDSKKMILFESSKEAEQWTDNFLRIKFLSSTKIQYDWLYCCSGRPGRKMTWYEWPLILQPFQLKNFNLDNSERKFVKYLSVFVVIGSKVLQSLWVSLPHGSGIILHFHGDKWTEVGSFHLDTCEEISSLLSVSDSIDPFDPEIWIASGNTVFIHSLIHKRNFEMKTQLQFNGEINALCSMGNNVLVAFDHNTVSVVSKGQDSRWSEKCQISLQEFIGSNDLIKEVLYCDNLIFVVFGRKIILCEGKENSFTATKSTETEETINAVFLTSEGLWLSLDKKHDIILFDKFLGSKLLTIALSSRIQSLQEIGSLTAIFRSEKYIWIGTKNGYIICISNLDIWKCLDPVVNIYCSRIFAAGSISQLIPFQNIQSRKIQKNKKKLSIPNESGGISTNGSLRRSLSASNVSVSSTFPIIIKKPSKLSFENYAENSEKQDIMKLMLAFGPGITKCCDKEINRGRECELETVSYDDPTIFTFYE